MSDGHIDGDNIICGLHGWDYRFDTGVSEYDNSETLPKFEAWIEDAADDRERTLPVTGQPAGDHAPQTERGR